MMENEARIKTLVTEHNSHNYENRDTAQIVQALLEIAYQLARMNDTGITIERM